jgi:hypothetical protein
MLFVKMHQDMMGSVRLEQLPGAAQAKAPNIFEVAQAVTPWLYHDQIPDDLGSMFKILIA